MAKDNLELVRFIGDDVSLDVSVSPREQTVWLTQEQMALLFGRTRSIITRHLRQIFESQELDEAPNVRKANFANSDKPVALRDSDVVISVGYTIFDNRVLIKDESDCSLAKKAEEAGDKITVINGQLLSLKETLKEAPT